MTTKQLHPPLTAVLALDGSAGADVALRLAAGLHWPPGSTIRAISVVDGLPRVVSRELPPSARETVDVMPADAAEVAAAFDAGDPPPFVERFLRAGRPASEILHETEHAHADLVIAGSRGQSMLDPFLLGSVSNEVVDHAPCSVLVARKDTATRILLADDGSEPAEAAVHAVADTGLFAGAEVRVVSVATEPPLLHVGIAPTLYQEAMAAQQAARDDAVREHREIAERTARRLAEAGFAVEPAAPSGSPAEQIVRMADWADLVVLGNRGRTGLTRLVLGSVARSVLVHAPCSVLVARPARQGRRDGPAEWVRG